MNIDLIVFWRFYTLLPVLWVLIGCATPTKPTSRLPVTPASQLPVDKNMDLVAILVKFADITTVALPVEKFERYFRTKVVWTIDQPTGLPRSFSGSAPAYGITATGTQTIDKTITRQGIWMKFPRTGRCVLVKDLLLHLPNFKRYDHLAPPIYQEDDPTQWGFYQAYTIESKAGYVGYDFALGNNNGGVLPENKQCLREVTATQYPL